MPSYNFITGKREYHGHKLKDAEKIPSWKESWSQWYFNENEIPEDANR